MTEVCLDLSNDHFVAACRRQQESAENHCVRNSEQARINAARAWLQQQFDAGQASAKGSVPRGALNNHEGYVPCDLSHLRGLSPNRG